jgi:hypothetical protein
MNTPSFRTGIIFLLSWILATPGMASSWVGLYGGDGYKPDSPSAIAATSDGGVILACNSESFGHGDWDVPDILILKFDGQGAVEWQETIGRRDYPDKAYSIIETRDGRYVLAGITYNPKTNLAEAWIVALKPNGKIAWQRSYDGQNACHASSIAECADGGFIAYGRWADPETWSDHAWLLRLDSEGNVLWQRAYGKRDDYKDVTSRGISVLADADGGYFIWGGYADLRTRPYVVGLHLAKLDSNGNILWQRLYKDVAQGNLIRTPDGGFALAGFGASGYSYITHLDAQGNVAWNRSLQWASPMMGSSIGILPEPAGGYVVLGARAEFATPQDYNPHGMWLIGVSDEGEIEWERLYIGGAGGGIFCRALDGGLAMAGGLTSWGYTFQCLKTEPDYAIPDPCTQTVPVQTDWGHASATVSDTVGMEPIDLAPAFRKTQAVPGITSVNEARSWCPVIKKVRVLHHPFRLELTGANFMDGGPDPDYPRWWVTIDGVKVPAIRGKGVGRIILKGGEDLKALVPIGKPVCIRVISLYPYIPLYNSDCFSFTRKESYCGENRWLSPIIITAYRAGHI